MQLGEKLRILRKSSRHTLLEVSERTGLSVSFLSDVERGRTNPSLDTMMKLAEFYQIRGQDLMKDVDMGPTATSRSYPPGLRDFLKETAVDEDLVDLLLLVEHRGKKKAQTKEDWRTYYYSLKAILGR